MRLALDRAARCVRHVVAAHAGEMVGFLRATARMRESAAEMFRLDTSTLDPRRLRAMYPRDISVRASTPSYTWMVRLDRTPIHIQQELLALAAHITERAVSVDI